MRRVDASACACTSPFYLSQTGGGFRAEYDVHISMQGSAVTGCTANSVCAPAPIQFEASSIPSGSVIYISTFVQSDICRFASTSFCPKLLIFLSPPSRCLCLHPFAS
eukprot:686144-Pleurochrysis_carterae.AAC.1